MTRAPQRAAWLVLCLIVAGGCSTRRLAAAVPRPEPATPASESGVVHEVQAGQTLWRIARVYDVPLDVLARTNGITDPTALVVGQKLVVPGRTELREVPPYPQPLADVAGTVPHATRRDLIWPVAEGRILSSYGAPRSGHPHRGLDIGGKTGQPILAALGGRVVYAGSTLSGYGRTVIVEHGDGLATLYAHGSELLVREGEWVEQGQRIARIGRSGNASTEHCHFEVRLNDVAVDPRGHLTAAGETR